MKFGPPALAVCALLAVVAVAATAAASSVTVPLPSSFTISGSGRAVDNGSNEYSPGPEPVTFFPGGDALYVRVPAAARNGTRLVTLDDRESGISFRNNTMLLPVYAAGVKAGGLIVTTDNLSATGDGYSGQVTGLELRLSVGPEGRGGTNYTADAVLLLGGLPAGAEYRVSFSDNGTVERAIAADLGAKGQTVSAMSPALGVEGVGGASEGVVGYVIVTVRADADWARRYGANNTSLYAYRDGIASILRPQVIKTENGTAYQAVAPGPGQFALVVAGPPGGTVAGASGAGAGELAALGGIIAVLLAALAAMVRRVTKR